MCDAVIHGLKSPAQMRLHPVAEEESRDEECQGRADGGRERDEQSASDESEDGTAGERHDRGARERHRGDRDIRDQERGGALSRSHPVVLVCPPALCLEELQRQKALHVQHEERRKDGDEHCQTDHACLVQEESPLYPQVFGDRPRADPADVITAGVAPRTSSE